MKRNSFLCLFLLALFLNNCSKRDNVTFNNSNNDNESIINYPEIILKKNLDKEYNIARWWFYSSNYHMDGIKCIDTLTTLIDSFTNIVSCDIKLYKLKIKQDTIIIKLFFKLEKDTSLYCFPNKGGFINTFIFIRDDDFTYRNDSHFEYNSNSLKLQKEIEFDTTKATGFEIVGFYPMRVENKMFPEFLRTTKAKLNPWLKQEAIKRGILKE